MYKRILVPLDGSEQSEGILPLVNMLAHANHADVILIRVVEYSSSLYTACYEYPPTDPALAENIQNQKRALNREVRDYLEQIASNPSMAGMRVRTEVSEGPVVEAILDSIDDFHADLIALSACSHHAGMHPTVGAVADRLLREATVPVLLIQHTPGTAFSEELFKPGLPLTLEDPSIL